MSVTPTTVLHAEESSETDQIQNVEIKQDENIAQEDSETNERRVILRRIRRKK